MYRGPLVGRHVELAALRDAAAEARAGQGSCVLLVGEPGIGKSRLVEELARTVAADMDVVWGRAWEAGGAPPYWPWTQVLRGVSISVTSPYVARVRGDRTDAAAATAEDRFLTFDAVTRHLASAAQGRPLAILLEDLHAADEPSLHMLAFLASQVRTAPILVLGTYRDVEARLTPAAGALLDRISRDAQVIHPRRLGAEDVAAIAAADPTLALDAAALAAVFERSEGNPLFIVELMRVIARRGVQGAVPASVRTAIREHLRGLPTELTPTLEVAAVIGRELAATVVAEVTRRALPEVLDALGSAVDLGVLVERGPGRFAFAHGLIAETLHVDLAASKRSELHLAVADALEREPARSLTEIAHHLLDAGLEHADRAAATARLAAEQARRQLAFEPAAALIERVLATAPPASQLVRFELQRLLAEVRLLGGADASGKEAAREAAAQARTLNSPELLARAALTYGLGYSFGLTDQVMVQLLEEALAALPSGDSAFRARLLARLAAALTPALDSGQPMKIARDAIEMARRLGDDRTRLDVFYAAISALLPFAPPRERQALNEEVLVLAARFDEPLITLRSHHRLVFDHAELGDMVGVENQSRAYEQLVDRLRLPRAQWPIPMFRAMLAQFSGRYSEDDAELQEAARLAASVGDTFFEPGPYFGHQFMRARAIGDDATLERERLKFTSFSGTNAYLPELTAGVLVRAGKLEEARACASEHRIFESARLHCLAQLACAAAEVAWELGDREGASELYPWLSQEDPPLPAVHGHAYSIDRPTAHSAMQLAATLGDLVAARRHYEHAATLLARLDARPYEAWLQLDFARILIAAGERGDEPRRLLAAARAINDSVGMMISHRIDAQEALLSTAFTPSATIAPPPPVVQTVQLRCEGEYWAIEGLGATCRLKASRGIEMLAKLTADPNRELHVLELSGAEVVDGGDAGEMLDAEAKRAYRARILELRESLAEAESWNNTARVERARDELEALEAELGRAAGLGGRDRRVGKAAERARINVQRRVTEAIRRIGEVDAALGSHLEAAVRTGTYCSYVPDRVQRPVR